MFYLRQLSQLDQNRIQVFDFNGKCSETAEFLTACLIRITIRFIFQVFAEKRVKLSFLSTQT